MNYQLHKHNDATETARAVAERILQQALAKADVGQKLHVAVSGGSTPKLLFEIMGEEFQYKMPWQSINIFWVDERCVAPTHPESNYGMTYDALLRKSYIPNDNIFRIKGEEMPSDEAERYATLLRKTLPHSNGWPVFDIVLLGIGDDGHTASIFPNNMALLTDERTVAVATHPTSGQKRITLTGKTICNATRIIFLVNGASKASIVRQIIQQIDAAKHYPATHIAPVHGRIYMYGDLAALGE